MQIIFNFSVSQTTRHAVWFFNPRGTLLPKMMCSLITKSARRSQTAVVLSLVTIFAMPAVSQAQTAPVFSIGGIVQTTWQKSGAGDTPMRLNGGNASFVMLGTMLLQARVNERLIVFGEIQTVRGFNLNLYALSAVYRATSNEAVQIEAGKFLAPFGNFLPRRYASENPLIDYPLTYNYRTALSPFQLPRTNAALLSARGKGHQLHYDNPTRALGKRSEVQEIADHIPTSNWGLKVVSREVYLTGAQWFGAINRTVYYAIAVANGALSNPVDVNDGNGVQLSARLRVTPLTGFDAGVSFSSAPYLNKSAVREELKQAGKSAERFRQSVLSADLAFSRGQAVLFAEVLFNRWATPFLSENLDLWGSYVEAKYTLKPRVFVAGRWSQLKFAGIADAGDVDGDGRLSEAWDYDVSQVEIGLGYRVNRNAVIKATYEFNRTREVPGGDPSDDIAALQAVVFF